MEQATLADLANLDYEATEANGLVGANFLVGLLDGGGKIVGYRWATEHGGPMVLMMLAEYAATMQSLLVAVTGRSAAEVGTVVLDRVMERLDLDREPPRLTVELVPAAQWSANLSKSLQGPQWDQLRRQVYRRAGYCCEICGGVGSAHPVDAHEVWPYEEAGPTEGIQRLVGLVGLCPTCHEVKHMGFARS